jgi:hypothetical protein
MRFCRRRDLIKSGNRVYEAIVIEVSLITEIELIRSLNEPR